MIPPYRRVQQEMGLRRTLENWTVTPASYLASPSHAHQYLLSLVSDVKFHEQASAYLFPGILPVLLAHWQKTIHGYSGFRAPFHDQLYRDLRPFPDETSIARLREVGVTYVVVHRELYSAGGVGPRRTAARAVRWIAPGPRRERRPRLRPREIAGDHETRSISINFF